MDSLKERVILLLKFKITYNLVRSWFKCPCNCIDKILSFNKLQLYKHPFYTDSTTAPQSIHILRLFYQHSWLCILCSTIITWKISQNSKKSSYLAEITTILCLTFYFWVQICSSLFQNFINLFFKRGLSFVL